MKAARNASQCTSGYHFTVAPNRATVAKIFTNSPVKKVNGFAPPGRNVPTNNLRANSAFGMAQHKPPASADIPAAWPPISPMAMPRITVAQNCMMTMRNISLAFYLDHCAHIAMWLPC
jgi:hypothetical protein